MKSYQDKKVTSVTAYKTPCRYNIFSQIHATTSYKKVEDTMSNDVFLAFTEIFHYYAMIYTSYSPANYPLALFYCCFPRFVNNKNNKANKR